MSRTTLLVLVIAVAAGGGAVYLGGISPEPPRRTSSSPAIDFSAASIPPVRVLLGGDPRPTWTLRIDGPYRITGEDRFGVLAQGPLLVDATIVAEPDGIRIGQQHFDGEVLTIEPRDDGAIWLEHRRYRGLLRLALLANLRVAAINVLPLEDYLASVLPSEMPGDFPPAAQQAQAIAARTYALYQIKSAPPGREFDMLDSVQSQVYGGMQYTDSSGAVFAVESAASRKIVEATSGVVLVYRDRLFCAYYSAVCGGATVDGHTVFDDAAPPLAQVACEFCRAGPHYRWTLDLSREQVQQKLVDEFRRRGKELGELTDLRVATGRRAGPPSFRVVGSIDSAVVTASNFRLYVLGETNAFSGRFELSLRDDALHVAGRGWGHGVGLCQWGSRGQALAGRTCEEILSYYYPGSRLALIR